MNGATRALLFIGGNTPPDTFFQSVSRPGYFVVAADSGLDFLLGLNWEPDCIVGDMDSLADRTVLKRFAPGIVDVSPCEKDETDTELGLLKIRERNITNITVIGGGGGRLDHLLGIYALFQRPAGFPTTWVTDNALVRVIETEESFAGMKGRTVSFFPAGRGVTRMKTRGLQWPLDALVWENGDAGISNQVTADNLHIQVVSGRVLMIHSLEEGDRL